MDTRGCAGHEHSGLAPLLGRNVERHALDALLGTVREGRSSTLVPVGEAAIGRTRLPAPPAARTVPGLPWDRSGPFVLPDRVVDAHRARMAGPARD